MEALLSPVFGPELSTYKRLWYGVRGAEFSGVTPGRFYDFRAFPIPYAPQQTTSWSLTLPEQYDGLLLHVHVTRESPSPAPRAADDIDVVATTPVTIFDVFLSKGLNTVVVTVDGEEIASRSVTCTYTATLLHAYASNIFEGQWQRLEHVETDIFSDEPTALTAAIVGFGDWLPTSLNWNRHSHGIVVNAFMNAPGSSVAVSAASMALLRQSLVLSRTKQPLTKSWLYGMPSQADLSNGAVMHVWAGDRGSARYPGAAVLAAADNVDVGRDYVGDVDTGDFRQLQQPYNLEYQTRRSWISMESSEDETVFEFIAHNHSLGTIQLPGLLDVPTAVHDRNVSFDAGRVFDTVFAVDPQPSAWVRFPVTPGSFMVPQLPMSFLDKTIEAAGVSLAPTADVTGFETVSWDETDSTATAAGWTAHASTPVYTPQPGEAASDAPGLLLTLMNAGAGHTHTVLVLTFAQACAVKLGTPLALSSQFPSAGAQHQHTLTLSWNGAYVIDVGNNHGHLVQAQEFTYELP